MNYACVVFGHGTMPSVDKLSTSYQGCTYFLALAIACSHFEGCHQRCSMLQTCRLSTCSLHEILELPKECLQLHVQAVHLRPRSAAMPLTRPWRPCHNITAHGGAPQLCWLSPCSVQSI